MDNEILESNMQNRFYTEEEKSLERSTNALWMYLEITGYDNVVEIAETYQKNIDKVICFIEELMTEPEQKEDVLADLKSDYGKLED